MEIFISKSRRSKRKIFRVVSIECFSRWSFFLKDDRLFSSAIAVWNCHDFNCVVFCIEKRILFFKGYPLFISTLNRKTIHLLFEIIYVYEILYIHVCIWKNWICLSIFFLYFPNKKYTFFIYTVFILQIQLFILV